MTTKLAIAFLPLTDCAVLAVAKEQGFAEAEGLDLTLVRDVSWANIRDRLVYGQVQAAHMLAPLAIAVTLGLSQHLASLVAPFKLGLNGNAVTLSSANAAALGLDPATRLANPAATVEAFARHIRGSGQRLVLGLVHRFSSHALQLRYWLGYAGIDPDREVTFRVLPPSFMVEALRTGEIDGFCAGEPWGSAAVMAGVGEIVATGAHIWQRGVEKVLALREDWAETHPEPVDALLRALDRAAAWCDAPENRDALVELLSRETYVGQSPDLIEPALSGRMLLVQGSEPVNVPDFLIFHREAAGFPWRSQALWIYSQMVRWGFVEAGATAEKAAANVFRSDLYRRALAGGDTPMPGASAKLEGAISAVLPVGSNRGTLTLGPDRFFDGRVFDPDNVTAYVKGFSPLG